MRVIGKHMNDLTKLTNDELLQEIDYLRSDVGKELMRRLELEITEKELNEILRWNRIINASS